MRKLKIYLDTSAISYLFADDAPEKMKETLRLWNEFKQERFEIYLSELTVFELQECSEPKKSKMFESLKEINYQTLVETDEIEKLANEYLKLNVLTRKSFDDCRHIAYAVVSNCDVIVSWNFKHLVNLKTINRVRYVNAVNNYKEISIVSPSMLFEEDENG